MDLKPRSVADFYTEFFEKLSSIGINVTIHAKPNEMDPAIPFAENVDQAAYDPNAAQALWQAMLKEIPHRFIKAVYLICLSRWCRKPIRRK